MQAYDIDTLSSIFDKEYRESPVKFNIDPIVLSVRLKKMIADNPAYLGKRLEDPDVQSAVTSDDFNEAVEVKEYFSKKLMWASLKASHMSSYRQNLMQYIQHPKTVLSKKEIGMIVTLPYFYDEDKVLDTISSTYRVENTPRVKPNLAKILRELVFIHTTSRWINKVKQITYWFADDNQYVYTIQVEENNVLRKFFEDIILTKSSSIFETHIAKVEYPFDHYKMFDYKLVKEKNA
jgi:hypothetical protein